MMIDGRILEALANGPSRRQAVAGVAIALVGLALSSASVWAGTEDGISHTSDAIHQDPMRLIQRPTLEAPRRLCITSDWMFTSGR